MLKRHSLTYTDTLCRVCVHYRDFGHNSRPDPWILNRQGYIWYWPRACRWSCWRACLYWLLTLLFWETFWQDQNDFHLMVGQVFTTADALGSLDVWPTQEDHRRTFLGSVWGHWSNNKEITSKTMLTNVLLIGFSKRIKRYHISAHKKITLFYIFAWGYLKKEFLEKMTHY